MRLGEHTKEPTAYRPPERAGGTSHDEPSATEAVERVLDAGQRLVTERIELARLDAEDALSTRGARVALVVVPGLFAFGGWWMLMAALASFLNNYFTPAVSLTIVGGTNVVLGGGIALSAWKSAWPPSGTPNAPAKGGAHP